MVSSTIIIILCLVAFAVIHSITASLPFKKMVVNALGSKVETFYLPVYSLIAVITILPVVYLLYLNPGRVLYIVPSPWRWVMVAGQLIAAVVAPRAFRDSPPRFKLHLQLSTPDTPESEPLNIRGIYRWIRDPFLLSGLVIIWLTPFMTVNLLIVYVITTIYFYIGSVHVEKRLISQFGDEYLEYQKKVHRFIPFIKGHY
ncbi:isoprenylcysteine carboxylmethyltransferase family protein [Methanococcoides sp. LMO-2]|uniref:Isoprenylcysteine carboxylmethyltransferase family protein n=1 Tax=Methanococcoides cohabitans TaxID=3136559 RepID=A0ABU9KSM0_9EURY